MLVLVSFISLVLTVPVLERRFQFLIVMFEPNEELVRLCRVKLWHHYFLTFNRHTPIFIVLV